MTRRTNVDQVDRARSLGRFVVFYPVFEEKLAEVFVLLAAVRTDLHIERKDKSKKTKGEG